MTKIRRRKTLQLSAAGALAAGTGGLAGILASGRAPAYAQTQTMHWLRWADFVPASDVLLKGEITKLCEKDLGMKLTVETINANDIQARITCGDPVRRRPRHLHDPQQLAAALCRQLRRCQRRGRGPRQGAGRLLRHLQGRRRPSAASGSACPGAPAAASSPTASPGWPKPVPTEFPKTWDEYRAVGKKLKAAGRPYGQTAGHTFGDAPGWWYPYLWSWGGKEVEADGKTVVLNTKETVESVKFAVALWKETMDEGGLAWDDTNNNRAFLSGSISATNNGASIYLEAKKKPDSYQTEKGTPMKDDILHAGIPGGAGGQFNLPGPFTNLLMKYSKNQDAAKKFLRWVSSKEIFDKWFVSQQGYTCGADQGVGRPSRCGTSTRSSPRSRRSRSPGACWAMPDKPNQKAAEVQTKYIIVDMYAKAIQGMDPQNR